MSASRPMIKNRGDGGRRRAEGRALIATGLGALQANAQTAAPVAARNVVLVHGAWADGSSWSKVIPLLQAAGLHVTSVQNPLTSLADAAAETRCALALQDGPTVLVGHSWSGTLVSEVGTDPKVLALVYVAARAPDAGEDFVALSGKFPTMPVKATTAEVDAGHLSLVSHPRQIADLILAAAGWKHVIELRGTGA
jgi:pimeloyl-ACP methyl ester carboxylesterase